MHPRPGKKCRVRSSAQCKVRCRGPCPNHLTLHLIALFPGLCSMGCHPEHRPGNFPSTCGSSVPTYTLLRDSVQYRVMSGTRSSIFGCPCRELFKTIAPGFAPGSGYLNCYSWAGSCRYLPAQARVALCCGCVHGFAPCCRIKAIHAKNKIY